MFPRALIDFEVFILNLESPPPFSPQITNYVVGCMLLKGSFWRVCRLSVLHSNSCHTAPHSCTSRSFGYSGPSPALRLSPRFCSSLSSVFFLSSYSSAPRPRSASLALFIALNASLVSRPSFLSEKAFVASLPPYPTSGPLLFLHSFLQLSQPHQPLCIKHVITECC